MGAMTTCGQIEVLEALNKRVTNPAYLAGMVANLSVQGMTVGSVVRNEGIAMYNYAVAYNWIEAGKSLGALATSVLNVVSSAYTASVTPY